MMVELRWLYCVERATVAALCSGATVARLCWGSLRWLYCAGGVTVAILCCGSYGGYIVLGNYGGYIVPGNLR